jgi:uncharacterized protein YjbI with pentapeptide repeats
MNPHNLRDILINHQRWLRNMRGGQRADLSLSDLRYFSLDGVNLHRTKFAGSNLAGASFIGSDLSEADMFGAILNGANFTGASLKDADLRGAHMRDAIFKVPI